LQANPVFERAEIVADMELSGGAHAAEDALFLCCGWNGRQVFSESFKL
jgi:hypothetical protein